MQDNRWLKRTLALTFFTLGVGSLTACDIAAPPCDPAVQICPGPRHPSGLHPKNP